MRRRSALLSSGPVESSVTSNGAAVVAFEHLRHQLAGRVLVEVGRQVADAQAARPAPWRLGAAAARDAGEDVQRVVARDLQDLARVVDEDRMREGEVSIGVSVGRGAHGVAQAGHRLVGGLPAAGLALEEDELAARGEVAAAQAEQHGGAHAFGGLGLHRQLLEAHAEPVVRQARRPSSAPGRRRTAGSPPRAGRSAAARRQARHDGRGRAARRPARRAGWRRQLRAGPGRAGRATRACRPAPAAAGWRGCARARRTASTGRPASIREWIAASA